METVEARRVETYRQRTEHMLGMRENGMVIEQKAD